MIRKALVYRTSAGAEPYADYVDSLRDRVAAAKIKVRVTRAERGNLGDYRNIGQGVIELRIDFGPGYRVYAGLYGSEFIVLLCAGDKGSQKRDVRLVLEFWQDAKRNL
jgi:putative addiction module killer protein